MNAATMRREMLDAARTFILKDPDHFSIAALCRQTGIRKSQLRVHFPTKHDLMSALVEESELEAANDQPADPFPADEPWVKNRFNILERALVLLEERTEEIARNTPQAQSDAETAPAKEPAQDAAELPPVVIGPDVPIAHLEMPPLPIDKPAPVFDARKSLRVRARQKTPEAPSIERPAMPKKARGWVWGVAAFWAGCIGLVALLLLISRPAAAPDHKPAQPAAKPAVARTAPAKAIATKQDGVLMIDATGSSSATRAAKNNDAAAETKTAIQYLKGDGVDADPGMAMRFGQNAAAKGDADAAFVVGALYAKGMAPNLARAADWYRRAADQGHPKAMYNLAMAYLSGHGVAKNTEEAVSWFTKAADAGYPDAAVNLGVLYDTGSGVTRDRDEALKWYRRAAELGDAEAADRVTSLERRLQGRYGR